VGDCDDVLFALAEVLGVAAAFNLGTLAEERLPAAGGPHGECL
jgi:hypothetical protein